MSLNLGQHDYTIVGGGIGFVIAAFRWYLHYAVHINDGLQTIVLLLSAAAVIGGWVMKGRDRRK